MAISFVVVLVTIVLAPISSLFICVALGLGSLDSLSTMEELTGGQELSLIRIPVILAADFLVHAVAVGMGTVVEFVALYVQFIAVIVFTESMMVFFLRRRLAEFCATKGE